MSQTKQSFKVQTFRKKGQGVEPDEIRPARNERHALTMAERLADTRVGVVALRQDEDEEFGVVNEPIVLVIHGMVPPIFHDLPF